MFDLLFVTEQELESGKTYEKMTTLYMNKLTVNEEDSNEIIGSLTLETPLKYQYQCIDELHFKAFYLRSIFHRLNFDPDSYNHKLDKVTRKYSFRFRETMMIFHSGKMTIGKGIPLISHSIDECKFEYIKQIIQGCKQLKQVKYKIFTQMTLDHLVFDTKNYRRNITLDSDIFNRMPLICQADFLKFYNQTSDHEGYHSAPGRNEYAMESLGFDYYPCSITQNLEYFDSIINCIHKFYVPPRQLSNLFSDTRSMFHFKQLDLRQTEDQITWLRNEIKQRLKLLGNVVNKKINHMISSVLYAYRK